MLLRLLRHEVEAVVSETGGQDYLRRKKLQNELADINKETRKLTTHLAALERRRAELMNHLELGRVQISVIVGRANLWE